ILLLSAPPRSFKFFFMFYFFFNDTETTEIYTTRHTLSLHDALPILPRRYPAISSRFRRRCSPAKISWRSEEHTSELQSRLVISYAVFCLTKKKQITELQSRLVISYAIFCLKYKKNG